MSPSKFFRTPSPPTRTGARAAAHRSGIVHRDLKPGNIMLTKSGAVRRASAQIKS